jgi:exopolyphosphatase/guanosine-5'-triphosphate,3'-diphosphate pyrophosphatase
MNRFNFVAPLVLTLLLGACAHHPALENSCTPRLRALIDVGSGATKLNLSEVAVCSTDIKLLRVIEEQASVALPLEAGKDLDGGLGPTMQTRTFTAIKELRDKAKEIAREKAPKYKSMEIVAVGTHALRTAKNGTELSQKSFAATEVPLMILTQEQEGEAGFKGAIASLPKEACGEKPVMVWDVGGGSMQMTYSENADRLHVEKVGAASEAFKKKLIAELPHRRARKNCPPDAASPNPITAALAGKATKLAENTVPAELREHVRALPAMCWVGIGGVHSKAVAAQVQKLQPAIKTCVCGRKKDCAHQESRYTQKELRCLARVLSEKTDCDTDISGPYSTTAVSNLFLILGFMQQLHIDTVTTANVNIGHSLVAAGASLPWKTLSLK